MGWCKKDVTPLLTHWSYVFRVRDDGNMIEMFKHEFISFPEWWRECVWGWKLAESSEQPKWWANTSPLTYATTASSTSGGEPQRERLRLWRSSTTLPTTITRGRVPSPWQCIPKSILPALKSWCKYLRKLGHFWVRWELNIYLFCTLIITCSPQWVIIIVIIIY